tara:strand:+ start:122 stop:283 length:162 start_codon:yes stop_codon:yes gene_type:complete
MSRRKHTSKFKFKVVLETLSERSTIQELGRMHTVLENSPRRKELVVLAQESLY